MFSVLLEATMVTFLWYFFPRSIIHFRVKNDGLSSLHLIDMTYTSEVTVSKNCSETFPSLP